MPLNINRREFVAGVSMTAVAAALPVRAFALTEKSAVALIQKTVDAVLRVINSGKAEAAMLVDFEGIFRSYADVPRIAGVSLGAPWRTATSAQKAGYVEAFQGYLARKYGRQFRKFAGAKIDIVRSRDGGRKGVLVLSMIDLPGDTPFEVEWQVIEVSGTPKMFDLIIEGISMLASERSEIGAMLEKRGGDIDRLIADLKST